MRDFNRPNRSGERRGFGNRGNDRPQMHQAVCSNCGNTCEVPFRPTGSKPVYCRDCFQTMGHDAGRSEGKRFDRPRFENRNDQPTNQVQSNNQVQFETLNTKLDKIIALLSAKTPVETPVLDSKLNEEIIDELAEEVVEEKPKKAPKKKAPKKTKSE